MAEQDVQLKRGTVVTVREAAQKLGVSERTIYRRLKSGKLASHPVSDNHDINDNMSVIVKRFEIEDKHVKTSQNMSESVNLSSMSVPESTLRHALETLGKRDGEIARMIECQQEMTQTIARLQEQLFELTRLVIAMNLERGKTDDQGHHTAQEKDGNPEETSENMIRRWIENLKARITHR